MADNLEQYQILGEASKIPGWARRAEPPGQFPPGAGSFKIYYKRLCHDAHVDENAIFGSDAKPDKMIVQKLLQPDDTPTKSTGYLIKMTGSEINKIKTVLGHYDKKSKMGGGIVGLPGKPDMYYHYTGSISKPRILLDFESGARKYRITLELTGAPKRTLKGRQAGSPPSTVQNERCTLKIIELVLGANTTWMEPKPAKLEGPKGQIALFNKKIIPALKQIWPGVALVTEGQDEWTPEPWPGREEWYWHFLAQFLDCLDATGGSGKILIPNNHYDVFDYVEFMKLITDIIEKEGPPDVDGKSWEQNPDLPPYFYNAPYTRWPAGPQGQPRPTKEGTWPFYGKIGEKDTWNPADIWLVKEGGGFKKLKEALGTKFKISEVNTLLKKAYRDGDILGISLKKSNATTTRMGTTHWTFHNLSFDPTEKRAIGRDPLQKITSGNWKMKFPYSEGSNKFTGTTYEWTLIAEADSKLGFKRKVDSFRMGTSQSGEQQTQNYEMKPGEGAAQYGKVPLNLMKNYFLNQKVVTSSTRPTGGSNPTAIWLNSASPSTSGHLIPEKDFIIKLVPKNKVDDNYKNWTKIVRKIKGSQTPNFAPTTGIDEVVDNLIKAGTNGFTREMNVVMQELLFANLMIDFVTKGGKPALQKVIKDLYYMAQKIGKVGTVQFGPFHKWS